MNEHHRLIAVLLLFGVITAGGALRLFDLGDQPLRADELLHHYVGRSLARGEEPFLPSGQRYGRGIDYSRLVAFTQGHVSDPVVAVRLPSAVMGVVGLFLMAGVSWIIAGPWAAVGSTFLLAFYPHAVFLSRMGRFYTMQMAIGLLAFPTGWLALREMNHSLSAPLSRFRAWVWTAPTVLFLLAAARVQIVTLTVAAGWSLCLLVVAARHVRTEGLTAVKKSAAAQVTVCGFAVAVAIVLTDPRLIEGLLATATSVPYWARSNVSLLASSDEYLRYLIQGIPVVMAVAPLAYLSLFHGDRLRGSYLLAWFGVPLLIHSFLPFKEERYIFLAVPALFVAVGIGASEVGRTLFGHLRRRHAAVRSRGGTTAAPIALLCLVVVGAAVPVAYPAVQLAEEEIVSEPESEPGWARAAEIIRARPELSNLPLGSFRTLHALFYVGHVDFSTHVGRLERVEDGDWVERDVGSEDIYSGRPVLTTPDAIRTHLPTARAVLILIEPSRILSSRTDPELAQALLGDAEELCRGRCGTVGLYRLELTPNG